MATVVLVLDSDEPGCDDAEAPVDEEPVVPSVPSTFEVLDESAVPAVASPPLVEGPPAAPDDEQATRAATRSRLGQRRVTPQRLRPPAGGQPSL